MGDEIKFVDILEREKQKKLSSSLLKGWIAQSIRPLDRYYDSEELNELVANSAYVESVIESVTSETGVSKEKLKQDVVRYLGEIGFNRKMWVTNVIKTMMTRLLSLMSIRVLVNEESMINLKKSIGQHPLLLIPSHRSYGDFIIPTYLFVHYELEVPAAASGVDLINIAFMGEALRYNGSFYMRRSMTGNKLYAATLKEYIRTIVAKYDGPLEFYIEGQRSRSNKGLPPKYGLLSWALLPLFSGEVEDVRIAPLGISFERLVDHGQFAYEHLGVPKKKETLGAMLKNVQELVENYGSIYMNMGTTFTVKQFLRESKLEYQWKTTQNLQELTVEQKTLVKKLGDRIVGAQQDLAVITITTILSILLMESLIKGRPQNIEEIEVGIKRVVTELKKLNMKIDLGGEVHDSVQRILVVQATIMKVDWNNNLRLMSTDLLNIPQEVIKEKKGHIMSKQTMVDAVPIIGLQVYINPVMFFTVPPAIITAIVNRGAVYRDAMKADYRRLRKMLSHEFFYVEDDDDVKFENALRYCLENDLVSQSRGVFSRGGNDRMQFMLSWMIWPFLTSISTCAQIFTEKKVCEHSEALKLVQERVEERQYHPYCLSLEATEHCIEGLVAAGAISKKKDDVSKHVICEVKQPILDQCYSLIKSVLPAYKVDFSRNNPVIELRLSPCRL